MRSSIDQPDSGRTNSDGPQGMGEDERTPNLRNAWLMVLERKWYALAVFLVVVAGVAAYTFTDTPMYRSAATVQILRHGPQVMRVTDVLESSITGDVDFMTEIQRLQSTAILRSVASRLTAEEAKELTDPYVKRSGERRGVLDILASNRGISPLRTTMIAAIEFRHPNPRIAARVANLIALEYIAYNSRLRVDEELKAVDALKERADLQEKHVEGLANALQGFMQRGRLISLESTKDIVTEKLKALNLMHTERKARLGEAEVRWKQVQQWRQEGRNLSELPFIASNANVAQLNQVVTNQRLVIAQLRERRLDMHPSLVGAIETLAQTEGELNAALDLASASVRADYENALQSEAEARRNLAEQEEKSLEMGKASVEYENQMRNLRVNEHLLETLMVRMSETSASSKIESENARIVDPAIEPGAPFAPRVALNMAAGVLAGMVAGLGCAYGITLIQDRVKTPFDVETLLGLPLLGVIPRVERMEQPDKAQVVSNGADPVIQEAFLSLYTALRIKDESRTAKLIMVTSTLPEEGKSFITTNLGQAFAAQGQRTVIVDCDLRKPNVQRSFRLRSAKGVIDYCSREAAFDEIVVRNVHPNLDVIVAGGRAKNPIQLLNTKEFEVLVAELGRRYDRVLFDTPPLGAVSDAMIVLPLMDGAIYTVQYNRVMRKAAQVHVRRLRSANIPVFGAVLNDMNARASGEYYVEYNDKLVKDYSQPALRDPVGTPQNG